MKYIFNENEINIFKLLLTESYYESLFLNLVDKEFLKEVSFNDKEVEQLIDLISNKFMEIGLLPNSEPNSIGLQIESLIDKLNS
jgi:hypothetical protein